MLIKDLPASKELDRKTMSAVRGGVDNQGLVNNQANAQLINLALAGPSIFGNGNLVMNDVIVDQSASNDATNTNSKGFTLYYPGPIAIGIA